MDAGADDYITKPFNVTELGVRLRGDVFAERLRLSIADEGMDISEGWICVTISLGVASADAKTERGVDARNGLRLSVAAAPVGCPQYNAEGVVWADTTANRRGAADGCSWPVVRFSAVFRAWREGIFSRHDRDVLF
jgi:CheY-like chemotaxis protein